MILSAANKLNENKTYVDSLNVFPVPDGDTGTNMALTFMSAAKDISNKEFSSACDVATAVAKATLRGARGNSGVILSQIFRGLSLGMAEKEVVSVEDFAAAVQKGCDTAYQAVMKPTEGTILTVIRFMAKAAVENVDAGSIDGLFAVIMKEGNVALDKTPEMLPQLKQAGVVDAGGKGLLYIFEGMQAALDGRDVSLSDAPATVQSTSAAQQAIAPDDIEFGYCTEFIIEKYDEKATANAFRDKIAPTGDCMLVIEEGEIVKVHIHTNNPGFVLEQAVKLGQLINIKIDNMRYQHSNIIAEADSAPAQKGPMKELAVISVAAGEGIAEVFTELGVSYVIRGGQTMNPSTDDILAAVEEVNAKNVIVLPNNKNIILAAEQAIDLAEVNVRVIPTKTIPQGITAMTSFLPEGSLDDNVDAMNEAIELVKSGSITHAVRNTSIDDKEIHEGDYLGMREGKIAFVNPDLSETFFSLIEDMVDEDSEIITIYHGEDVPEDDAAALCEALEEKYPDCDVYVRSGNQPVYYYFIAVE
ncbi:MAG: DAK2 domain-containing protein [Clostridia bacterium]|nr:DAK2 domain-containing protein [Clostridia bacterium]